MFWETMQGRRNQIPADGDWKILYDIDKAPSALGALALDNLERCVCGFTCTSILFYYER